MLKLWLKPAVLISFVSKENWEKEKLRHLLLLFVSCPLGGLGTVDRFGLRAVDEVQQLVYIPVVDGTGGRQLRVLTLRQLLFAPRQARAQLLSDLGVVAARRRGRRLRQTMLSLGRLSWIQKLIITENPKQDGGYRECVSTALCPKNSQ